MALWSTDRCALLGLHFPEAEVAKTGHVDHAGFQKSLSLFVIVPVDLGLRIGCVVLARKDRFDLGAQFVKLGNPKQTNDPLTQRGQPSTMYRNAIIL